MEKCINYQATALEMEQLVKNWVEINRYEIITYQNYKNFEINGNYKNLKLEIKELMDSITIIMQGDGVLVDEMAAYLNLHLIETASFEIKRKSESGEKVEPNEVDDLRKCPICEELQPKQFNFCLKCGAILE